MPAVVAAHTGKQPVAVDTKAHRPRPAATGRSQCGGNEVVRGRGQGGVNKVVRGRGQGGGNKVVRGRSQCGGNEVVRGRGQGGVNEVIRRTSGVATEISMAGIMQNLLLEVSINPSSAPGINIIASVPDNVLFPLRRWTGS